MEVLPVVNSVGYVDENGISTDNASLLSEGAQDFLDRYRIVQYNNLFGGTGRSDVFFSPQPE